MSDAPPKSAPSRRQDLIGGLLSIAFGLFAMAVASGYPMGSLLRMGPGFFPTMVAALIVLLGLVLTAAALRSRPAGPSADIRLRSVLAIGSGIALFALLLERAGLIPATLVLVLMSSLAESRWRLGRAAALAFAMAAAVYVIFIVILQIHVAAVNL
jgi:Tripartite tricarboxylate transporter TctB family